jgi:hypothetical protein
MNLIDNNTVTVLDVATDSTRVPLIVEDAINLSGWTCGLVYQDAEYRIYRVLGSSNYGGANSTDLATGIRIYKRSPAIGAWLLSCWTHGIEDNPQMAEPFGLWFKRRTAPEEAKPKRSRDPIVRDRTVTRFSQPYAAYPTYTTPTPKPKPASDGLDGLVGDVGKKVINNL